MIPERFAVSSSVGMDLTEEQSEFLEETLSENSDQFSVYTFRGRCSVTINEDIPFEYRVEIEMTKAQELAETIVEAGLGQVECTMRFRWCYPIDASFGKYIDETDYYRFSTGRVITREEDGVHYRMETETKSLKEAVDQLKSMMRSDLATLG